MNNRGILKLLLITVLMAGMLFSIPAYAAPQVIGGGSSGSEVAGEGDYTTVDPVGRDDMIPLYPKDIADGVYEITVDSSSSMFRVVQCTLTVQEAQMEATLTLSGTGYLCLYLGSAEEAAQADAASCYDYEEDEKGAYTYTIPVEALNKETACAAYSIRKKQWYDRTLVFLSDGIPEGAITLPESSEEASAADSGNEYSSGLITPEESTGTTQEDNASQESAASATEESVQQDTSLQESVASAAENASQATKGSLRNNLPILITAGIAVAGLIVIAVILLRKKKKG